MHQGLSATTWKQTMDKIRICHISHLLQNSPGVADWKEAFDLLINSIKEERLNYPDFAKEISDLTNETGSSYSFNDILEEYFDFLENTFSWNEVIDSCDKIIPLFKWEAKSSSEYKYRKGNALLKLKRTEEAKKFNEEWLKDFPDDLYAVTSNILLLISLGELAKALTLTELHLSNDLKCNRITDTFMTAANKLCELTEDENASQQLKEKITEYNKLSELI